MAGSLISPNEEHGPVGSKTEHSGELSTKSISSEIAILNHEVEGDNSNEIDFEYQNNTSCPPKLQNA